MLLHKVLHSMDLNDEAMNLFVLLTGEEYKFYEVRQILFTFEK